MTTKDYAALDNAGLKFTPLTVLQAREMTQWRYYGPYAAYNVEPARADQYIARLTSPGSGAFAVANPDGLFLAMCIFGHEARISGGHYDLVDGAHPLDAGIAMRPEYTGHGVGIKVARAQIVYAQAHFDAARYRVSIAAWNHRAQRLAQFVGFEPVARFDVPGSGQTYVVMVR